LKEVPRNSLTDRIRSAVAPNSLDKLIQWADPVRAAQRMHARMQMAIAGGYTGGKMDRRPTKNWITGNNSADQDILPDLDTLRHRSRDLCRNEPLALGAVNTNVSNVVGSGLELSSTIDYETLGWTRQQAVTWQKQTERRFRLWAASKNCDITRHQNFYELQSLAYRSTTESGDVLVLMPWETVAGFPFETRIQLVEADRISNPNRAADTDNLVAGVALDSNGAPTAYHISRQHPGAMNVKAGAMTWDTIPAFGSQTGRRTALHLFFRIRPGQTRGVPYLAPVIEHLKLLGRFTDAELQATVVSSMFSVFVTSESGSGIDGLIGGTSSTGANAERALKLEPGLVAELNPGDKIETAQPGRPNGAFDPFVQAILRQIGVALEIPFEILVKHFTASYSASRAAMVMAWQFFKLRREWLASNFCQPIYEAWMDEQVGKGDIIAPGYFEDPLIRAAYVNAEWIGDAPGQLDPVKEVSAAEYRLRLGLTTLAEETISLSGRNWEENLAQRAQESEAHKAANIPYLPNQNAQQQSLPDQKSDPQDPNEDKENAAG